MVDGREIIRQDDTELVCNSAPFLLLDIFCLTFDSYISGDFENEIHHRFLAKGVEFDRLSP